MKSREKIIADFKNSAEERGIVLPCYQSVAARLPGIGDRSIKVLIDEGLVHPPSSNPPIGIGFVLECAGCRKKPEAILALANGKIAIGMKNCGPGTYQKIVQWALSGE